MNDTSERFDERGVAEIGFRFEPQQVFLDEPRGDDNGFGVRAIQKQQIFAEIFLAGPAVKTFAARRGIGHDHAVADLPSRSSLGASLRAASLEARTASARNLRNHARQSWPKTAGGTIILA